jgi:hypothetical protein
MFRDSADEDYLVARMALRSSLHYQFCWSSQQAIEKYMKAAILLNSDEPVAVVKGGHGLSELFEKCLLFSGDLLPLVLCPPRGFWPDRAHELRFFEKTEDYIARVEAYGDPNNRYRMFSIVLDKKDLHKLDQVVFMLRRIAFPLDIEFAGTGLKARDHLKQNRGLQLHSEMAFQKRIHKAGGDRITQDFEWINWAFFYEKSRKESKVTRGTTAYNSEPYILFEQKSFGALDWLSKSAVPNRIGDEIRLEIEIETAKNKN